MKKMIAMLLALTMLATLFAGCQTSSDDKKVLKVAISPDFAPMEFVDENGELVGFDVTLAKHIAKELGMELELKPMSFDACQTSVATGQVDMAISGFSWLPSRAENYNLSDTYHAGDNEDGQTLITTKENAGKFPTAESLKGLKVGAQTASLQEWLCQQQLPDTTVVPVGDLTTGIMQLKKGDFVVMAVADGNAEAILASNPELDYAGFDFVVTEEILDNLILLKKGNDELTAKVNDILAKAKAANLYEGWYEEAKATAGIEVSYDDEGNVDTTPAE